MNIQNLMQQAQKMQNEIMKKKEELNKKEFSSESELVKLTMNGKKEILKVDILNKESFDLDDLDMLEDMILIASKNAIEKIDKEFESVMGKYGSALNGLM
jgi:DNA-binding YbaB/EbfC family protein